MLLYWSTVLVEFVFVWLVVSVVFVGLGDGLGEGVGETVGIVV